jgi:hypothetical protein
MRNGRTAAACLLPALVIVVQAACASSIGPSAAAVAASIETSAPGCRVSQESRISLAGLKLAVVKMLAGMSGEAEEATAILDHISRVEVATYRADGRVSCAAHGALDRVDRELSAGGWWPMVTERGDADMVRVFAHGDGGGDLDGLYVIEFDGNELEVVRLEGRIERLVAEAVSEDPGSASRVLAPGG